jgi:Na+/H+-dicarboxylate symporter
MSTIPFLSPLKLLARHFERMIDGRLWLKVIIALCLGVIAGVLLGPDLALVSPGYVKIITAWLAFPGQVFLAIIQMIVVPLVLASIVLGLASNNNPVAMKKNGLIAVSFIMLSTAVAAAIGIFFALSIEPGHYINMGEILETAAEPVVAAAPQGFPQMSDLPAKVSGLIPKNPLASMVTGEMLQVILFAAVLGAALMSIPASQSKPLYDVLVALQEVSIRIVSWVMRIAPIAVFGLIAKLVANVGIEVLGGMAIYVLTVLLGLLALALIYFAVVKISYKMPLASFFTDVRELLLLAFSTSSSAAVMPISLQVAENKLKIPPDIVRFVIPLGATINMTGTALYQGVATVFLAQVFNVDLTLTNYLFIVTMSVAASIGSPATPGAGIIILSTVLVGVGIPEAGIALILGVDRILDMCRTAINVLGDVVTCTVVDSLTDSIALDAQEV